MYWWMSVDALLRIAYAIAILFVVVPWLAKSGIRRGAGRRPSPIEIFLWNVGVGITILTLAGQLFSLAGLFSLVTLIALGAVVILFGRAVATDRSPWTVLRRIFDSAFLAILNIFDGRVNVRRRIRRWFRRTLAAMRAKTEPFATKLAIAGWSAVIAIATAFRLYRPLSTANLGFSDTYVHLYLLKLLETGRQVDPDWGPYPRGLHFLLMAIHEITNVDEILLLNFFGAFSGVLMTIGVAYAVQRISKSLGAGLAAGLVFATLVGGPGQYFILGGAFATDDPHAAITAFHEPYDVVARNGGDFDLALTSFQRQSSTLPQELAIALLFPAAMFLLDYFRTRELWYLLGFAGCSAAIAAVHSGVVVPLVLMCAIALVASAIYKSIMPGAARRAMIAGAIAVLAGSLWMLAYIVYPYSGGKSYELTQGSVPNSALFYFPLLRALGGANAQAAPMWVAMTPFLIVCIAVAIALIVVSFIAKNADMLWIAAAFFLFLVIHFSSRLELPQIVETARNSQWFLMSIVVLGGVALAEAKPFARSMPAVAAVVLAIWVTRIPRMSDPAVHDRLVNYSGYGGSALAVLRIERSFEPYTWTIVSYGQEFPMVLHRGFHLPASDFLDKYDPTASVVPIPTPDVFVIVEKTPHQFEIGAWARHYSRAGIEQRLQTWVQLYQATHRNLRIYYDDEHVRVYELQRTQSEIERSSRRASR